MYTDVDPPSPLALTAPAPPAPDATSMAAVPFTHSETTKRAAWPPPRKPAAPPPPPPASASVSAQPPSGARHSPSARAP